MVMNDIGEADSFTAAFLELINQFPGIPESTKIEFSVLGEENGIAMFPVSGAVIESENEDITGRVTQICLYPCCITYRIKDLSGTQKMQVKECLDNLGKWLEKESVYVNDTWCMLTEYPMMVDGSKILSVVRQSQAYQSKVNENLSEDWVIYLSARYQKEFEK